MRLRRSVAWLVVPLLLACLTGCADNRPGGGSIEVIAGWGAGEQATFVKILNIFERESGVRVRYISGGDDLSTLLQTRIQGGNPPNVAIIPSPGVVRQLVTEKAAKRLDPLVVEAVEDSYAPIWKQLGTVDGQLYSVYFKATNKSRIWYDNDVFVAHGLKAPKNWDDFLKLCEALSRLGIRPVSVGAADGWVLTDWFENVYLQINGGEMYNELSQHKIPWIDVSVRRTFETLAQILGRDDFLDGGRDGALQVDFPDSVVNVFGPQHKAAMVFEGDFVAGVIGDKANPESKVGENALNFPFPRIATSMATFGMGDNPVVVGGDAAVALTDDPATTKFMEFLASPKPGTEWAKLGGFISPNKLVPLHAYPDEVMKSMAEQVIDAGGQVGNVVFDMSDMYPAQFGGTRGAGAWKDMQDFLGNPADIDGVMQRLEADARQAER